MDAEPTIWPRRPPTRSAGRLVWTAIAATGVGWPLWLVFGSEPVHADAGAINPLTLIAPAVLVAFVIAMIPMALSIVRRPSVRADGYALTVRPGAGRTLVLPWASLAEVSVIAADGEAFLVVRCAPAGRRSGDTPRWWDQWQLRALRRDIAPAGAYDLAVAAADFVGDPGLLLAALARTAPPYVAMFHRREVDPTDAPPQQQPTGDPHRRPHQLGSGPSALALEQGPSAARPALVAAPSSPTTDPTSGLLALPPPPAPLADPAPGPFALDPPPAPPVVAPAVSPPRLEWPPPPPPLSPPLATPMSALPQWPPSPPLPPAAVPSTAPPPADAPPPWRPTDGALSSDVPTPADVPPPADLPLSAEVPPPWRPADDALSSDVPPPDELPSDMPSSDSPWSDRPTPEPSSAAGASTEPEPPD